MKLALSKNRFRVRRIEGFPDANSRNNDRFGYRKCFEYTRTSTKLAKSRPWHRAKKRPNLIQYTYNSASKASRVYALLLIFAGPITNTRYRACASREDFSVVRERGSVVRRWRYVPEGSQTSADKLRTIEVVFSYFRAIQWIYLKQNRRDIPRETMSPMKRGASYLGPLSDCKSTEVKGEEIGLRWKFHETRIRVTCTADREIGCQGRWSIL